MALSQANGVQLGLFQAQGHHLAPNATQALLLIQVLLVHYVSQGHSTLLAAQRVRLALLLDNSLQKEPQAQVNVHALQMQRR